MTSPSIRLSHAAFALLISLPAAAWAAPAAPVNSGKAKFTKQETQVQATQTKLTKPEAPPPTKKETGPVLTVDQFVQGRQGKIQTITDAQISKMKRLITVTPDDDPQKPDFFFRLGELFAEKQRFYFSQAHALDQKIFDAPAGQKTSLTQQQQGFQKSEEKWLLEAVKAYIQSTKYKKYERMDEVLFKLAFLLTSVKKEDQAREFFLRLIKDYPNSKYIPDAYLSFAEFYFDKGEMENALKFYEKVEQFPKSSVYPYAVYKKGWCYVNMGDFKTALETFVGVVRMATEGKVNVGAAQKQSLVKEAKKDIVKAYAHVGGPDKAWEFFQRTGGDYAPKMMEALAELYWEQGKFGDSSRVYKKIIAQNMDSPRICEWQGKVVRNTLSAGTKRDQVQEIERLGAVYDKVGQMKGLKKDQTEECRNAFHDTSKELALIWHKEAQKTKNADTYQLVQYVYKEFLRHFPDDKDSYDMNFYYGELLWTLERWKDAAEQYTHVVEMNPKGKYAKDSAYAAVLGWKNALQVDDEGLGPDAKKAHNEFEDPKKKKEPKTIPEFQLKMIAAFDTYIKYVPDAPELPVIRYRKARIYYEYNHFDEAAKLFQEVVEKHPNHELSIYSANLLLDSLNAQGKTKEVVAWVDKFLEMPNLMKDPEFGKQMISLKSDTYDLEGREYEKQRNYKECGRSLLAAADSLPEHPKHAERLWNAGQCFQNAHLVGQALKARQQLIKDHPKDPLAQKALFRVAAGYHQLAYYSKAAENYEDFASKFPGEGKATEALGNATTFRIGLGESDKAIADMDSFVKFYGGRKPQDAAGVYFQMSEVYEKDKKYDELARHLESYLKKWGKEGGPDRQILAHFRLGEMAWKGSCSKAAEDGACLEVKRVAATGRQKVIADLNKKLGKKKRIKEIKTQCGPPTKSKIILFDRNKALAAKAQDHFMTVVKLWKGGDAAHQITGKDVDARGAAASYAVAGAAFHIAEKQYEDFLRIQFPGALDFQQPSQYDSKKKQDATKKKMEESVKKFASYLDTKSKQLEKARTMYLDVFKMKQAQWTIASAARVGQIYQDFAGQLYTAEIPKDLKEVDQWGNQPKQIYCDALEDKAEPIEVKAVDGFEKCLTAATDQSWYNEWSRLCERELNQMKPSEYPLSSEVKPEAGYVSTAMSPTPVISELSTEVAAGSKQ